jgi:serine/threonine protein kinase
MWEHIVMTEAVVVDLARQIFRALVFLHAHDIAHRDLSPGCILLLPKGASYHVKLTRFEMASHEPRPVLSREKVA